MRAPVSKVQPTSGQGGGRNRATGLAVALVFFVMLGAAFAAVPLYRLFCQATGLGGTTQRARAAPTAEASAVLTIRFNAETAPDLGWEFRPLESTVTVHPGEERHIFYRAVNRTAAPATGRCWGSCTTPFTVEKIAAKAGTARITKRPTRETESLRTHFPFL